MNIVEEFHCRTCMKRMDAHSAIEDENLKPNVGDYSICAYCGTISCFDEQMNLRPLTVPEQEELQKDKENYHILQAISKSIKEKIQQN